MTRVEAIANEPVVLYSTILAVAAMAENLSAMRSQLVVAQQILLIFDRELMTTTLSHSLSALEIN